MLRYWRCCACALARPQPDLSPAFPSCRALASGSFAAAVAESGPRIVVFEVGGVIDLQGATVRINEPHLTIAGQTTPNPGITFIRGGERHHRPLQRQLGHR